MVMDTYVILIFCKWERAGKILSNDKELFPQLLMLSLGCVYLDFSCPVVNFFFFFFFLKGFFAGHIHMSSSQIWLFSVSGFEW